MFFKLNLLFFFITLMVSFNFPRRRQTITPDRLPEVESFELSKSLINIKCKLIINLIQC